MINEKSSLFKIIFQIGSYFLIFLFTLSSFYAIVGITFSIPVDAQTPGSNLSSSTSSNNGSGTLIEGTNFRQDISGKYFNMDYGIVNLEIPEWWYASEDMLGDKGIGISMHPGTADEFLNKLTM